MELETINKLYLELSQIATAETKNDQLLISEQMVNVRRGKLLRDIFNHENFGEFPTDLITRVQRELDGA